MAAKHIRQEGDTTPEVAASAPPPAASTPEVAAASAPETVPAASTPPPAERSTAATLGTVGAGTVVLRRVLIGIGIVVALLAVVAAGFVRTVNARLAAGVTTDLRATLAARDNTEPFYTLFVGVETNTAYDSDATGRADAIILARTDTANRTATLISIPGNLTLAAGDGTTQRLDNTFATGGATALTQAVDELTGASVAHYVEVDLTELAAVIDQVGGIDVTLPVAACDPDMPGLTLAAGTHHLDGYTALMLVRSHHAYDAVDTTAGEAYRAANQRAVLAALAGSVLARGRLALPGTIAALADHLTTDMGISEVVGVTEALRGMDAVSGLRGGEVPTTGGDAPTGDGEGDAASTGTGGSLLDADAWATMMKRIDAGETPYADAGDDPAAGVAAVAGMGEVDNAEQDDGGTAAAGVEPEYGGTVSVLNATDVEGLATERADGLGNVGFEATAGNAPAPADESRVVYNGDDAAGKARAVADELGIASEPVANDGTLPTDANVVVVLGTDAV